MYSNGEAGSCPALVCWPYVLLTPLVLIIEPLPRMDAQSFAWFLEGQTSPSKDIHIASGCGYGLGLRYS